jgi:thioredoxin-like negative regulator of GroEL
LSDEHKGRLAFAKMDIDASQENNRLASDPGIQAIPTLMIFKNGQMIGRLMVPHASRLRGKGSECIITGQTQELLSSKEGS